MVVRLISFAWFNAADYHRLNIWENLSILVDDVFY